jgi:DNA invertase Pin-like site-specific DNA recombinase
MAKVEIIKANNLIAEEINTERKLKKVCAYARVSTDSEEQLTSYDSQIKYYSDYINSNPNWKFVGIYADEGISGTQVKHRTEFQRMINDALNGKIDIIITKSISRFARNVVDTLNNVRELRECNVDVYFEKENIHTIDTESEMFLGLCSMFAQAESESISQNVKMGIKSKMTRGEFVGCPKCYGYNWNKETKELEINEEQAKIVRMIFNWYADGLGTRVIANKLKELGYKTEKGYDFRYNQVGNIIKNEKYVGDYLGQKSYIVSPLTHKRNKNFGEKEKYYVKDHHIPIISRELWNKCQELLNKRRNEMPEGQQYSKHYCYRYIFSSKIECGICGANYVHRMSGKQNGKNYFYWSCYNKVSLKEKCPDSLIIREEILKEMFVKVYNSIIEKKHKTKEKLIIAIKDTLSSDDSKKDLNKLSNEKQTLQNRLSNLIDLKLDDIENKDVYNEKEKEINSRIKEINEQIEQIEYTSKQNKDISKQLKNIEKIIYEEEQPIKEFDDAKFENLIEKIVIGEKDSDGNINPNVVRFILKIGTDYKFNNLSFVTNKKTRDY